MNTNPNTYLPEFCTKETLILGCGNRLFGDDGFGPAVVDHLLASYEIPEHVYVMDVGTGVRKLLFTLCLSSELPRRIVIIDAVDKERVPGEVFQLPLDDIPSEKIDDFSLHQVPSSNLAQDLKQMGVEVDVLACQISHIPDSVEVGLSPPVARAVPKMCEMIAESYFMPRVRLTRKKRGYGLFKPCPWSGGGQKEC